MKIEVEKTSFLAALGIAVRGASTRSAVQTLAGVMIRIEDGQLELQATDLELGVRIETEAQVEREGSAVVPGRLLLDVVRSLPSERATIEYRSSQGDVAVTSGPASFHLRTLPSDEFPRLPDAGDASTLALPAPAFVETVNRVARAASGDETRPHLTGALVSASEREPRMVATDSYRLSVKETPLEQSLDGSLEANVPARTLQELGRIASTEAADEIEVVALE